MNMIPFGVILISGKEHIDYHNNEFARIFGFDNLKFTVISQWLDIVFSDTGYRRQVGGILFFDIPYTQTGNQRIYTATVFTHQNEEKLVQFTSLRLADEQFLMICEDVTEARKQEAKLQQAQKMEAIGSMAGAVAHDINNILKIGRAHV